MTQERKLIAGAQSELIFPDGPRFVNHSLHVSTASSTIATGQKPNGTQEGDLLVSCISCVTGNTPGSLGSPAGWTNKFNFNNSNGVLNQTIIEWKVAGASEPSEYTWSIGFNGSQNITILRFDNIFAAAPDFIGAGAQVASTTQGIPTPIVVGDISSTRDDSWLIGLYTSFAVGDFVTPAPEFTQVINNSLATVGNDCNSCVAIMKLPTAGATGTRSWDRPTERASTACHFVLQPHTGALHVFTDVADVSQDQEVE